MSTPQVVAHQHSSQKKIPHKLSGSRASAKACSSQMHAYVNPALYILESRAPELSQAWIHAIPSSSQADQAPNPITTPNVPIKPIKGTCPSCKPQASQRALAPLTVIAAMSWLSDASVIPAAPPRSPSRCQPRGLQAGGRGQRCAAPCRAPSRPRAAPALPPGCGRRCASWRGHGSTGTRSG